MSPGVLIHSVCEVRALSSMLAQKQQQKKYSIKIKNACCSVFVGSDGAACSEILPLMFIFFYLGPRSVSASVPRGAGGEARERGQTSTHTHTLLVVPFFHLHHLFSSLPKQYDKNSRSSPQ